MTTPKLPPELAGKMEQIACEAADKQADFWRDSDWRGDEIAQTVAVAAFHEGAAALFAELLAAAPEFSAQAVVDEFIQSIPADRWVGISKSTLCEEAARWQHAQLAARIAALKWVLHDNSLRTYDGLTEENALLRAEVERLQKVIINDTLTFDAARELKAERDRLAAENEKLKAQLAEAQAEADHWHHLADGRRG